MTIVLRHTPIALALALMGQAAMADQPILAPTVVITGTRVEQNSFDLPMAIDHIATLAGRERGTTPIPVDVFAHCIGGVMLSMALLTDAAALQQDPGQPTRYPEQLQRLPGHERR